MEPYKHPAIKSKTIGVCIVVFFGIYGMYRFYIGDKKAGFVIFSISILAVIGILFQIKFYEYILAISGVVYFFEVMTFAPRLNRYNEKLTKHYL